jgi:hypothetical protein
MSTDVTQKPHAAITAAPAPAENKAAQAASAVAPGADQSNTETKPTNKNILAAIPGLSGVAKGWDNFTDWVRKGSPAALVNNSPRAIFIMKIVADGFGILSGLGLFYKGGDPEKIKKARSPLRVAANVISLSMLIPGTMYKEKPVSKEQEEEYEKMGFGEYLWTKLKHAFNPKDHIVETAALGMMINGILTVGSGLWQSIKKEPSEEIKQGLFTVAAGAAWGLIPNRERAWQVSTAIFTARIPTKYKQAHKAYYEGLPGKGVPKGDMFQMGNFILQQASNMLSIFYAGVKKLPDGTIVRLGKKGEQEFEMNELQNKLNIKDLKFGKSNAAAIDGTIVSNATAEIAASVPQAPDAAIGLASSGAAESNTLGTAVDVRPTPDASRTLAEGAIANQSPEAVATAKEHETPASFAEKVSSNRPEKSERLEKETTAALSHAARAEASVAAAADIARTV